MKKFLYSCDSDAEYPRDPAVHRLANSMSLCMVTVAAIISHYFYNSDQ